MLVMHGTGKWAHASEQEVQDMKAQGLPYCYRMRSPDSEEITFDDLVRGPIKFNTNDVGDFVVIRSNGQPVYVSPLSMCLIIQQALYCAADGLSMHACSCACCLYLSACDDPDDQITCTCST